MTVVSSIKTTAALLMLLVVPGVVAAQADDEATAPEYSRKGADTCIACHDDQKVLAVFRTKHAVPEDAHSPFGHGQLQCEACHGPGGNHAARVRRGQERPAIPAFGSESLSSVAEQNSNCINCHEKDLGFAWHASSHDSNSVSCAGCHTVHVDNDPVLTASTQAAVCFDCHQQVRTQSMKPYAHPIRQGEMSCNSCHSPHGETTDRLLVRQTTNATCFDCHAEQRGPYLWEHAPVAEDCTNCHDPHGSSQPGMLTMRAPLLCQGCHSQDGHPSLPQDESGLVTGLPSKYLLGQSCLNCHSEVHGSNHPSGSELMR
jgi:DmsE family decaheme c-type cytochrome